MESATLELDPESIGLEDLSVPGLVRELNLRRRPNWILRRIMNTLEERRREKGLGWSRPWNKSGLNVFRTHIVRPEPDRGYLSLASGVLLRLLEGADAPYRDFACTLLSDPALLVFTFYHNHEASGEQHEGLTLSFGRKVPGDSTRRDRLDLILEDKRREGRVDGHIDRIRLFACPWDTYRSGWQHFAFEVSSDRGHIDPEAQNVYDESVRLYHAWKSDESRQWKHWSASFIDYFGPRSFIPVATSFS